MTYKGEQLEGLYVKVQELVDEAFYAGLNHAESEQRKAVTAAGERAERDHMGTALRTIESFKPLVHAARKVALVDLAIRRTITPASSVSDRIALEQERDHWIEKLNQATQGYPSTDGQSTPEKKE